MCQTALGKRLNQLERKLSCVCFDTRVNFVLSVHASKVLYPSRTFYVGNLTNLGKLCYHFIYTLDDYFVRWKATFNFCHEVLDKLEMWRSLLFY